MPSPGDSAALPPTPTLSVLIATHRRPEGLRRLLAAIRPSVANRADRQVIVINDGSHDDAYAAVAAEFADVAHYESFQQNRGIVATRNAALALATGAYCVFTDDDCEPPPWWLDWLTATLALHPEIDVVAGNTAPLWTRRSLMERVQAAWFIPRPTHLGKWPMLVTANAAIRTSLAREVGGFGFAKFSGAGEDTEMSIRLNQAHARFRIDPVWTVAHEVGASLGDLLRRYRRYGEANRYFKTMGPMAPPGVVRRNARSVAAIYWSTFRFYAAAPNFARRAERLAAAAIAAAIQTAYLRGLGFPDGLRSA